MKIGIDASLITYIKTGIGWYILNLIKNLSNIDKKNDYFIFLNQPLTEDLKLGRNFHIITDNFPKRFWWRIFKLPNLVQKNNLDVFHSPDADIVPFYNGKTITTIHDLAVKIYPQGMSRKALIYYNFFTPLAIKKTKRIIAVSYSTKKDIEKFYPLAKGKIEVVHSAVNFFYKKINMDKEEELKFRKNFTITKPFGLFIGMEKRKNLDGVLRAFGSLKKKIDCQLVLCGIKGFKTGTILNKIEELGIKDRILVLGYLSKEDLRMLYNLATVFIYPSFYEGFGIPILEAMACGTPVITSNTSSMPEVAGDAAILISPHSLKELEDSIYQIFSNNLLQKELSIKGLKWVKNFSWQKTARQTLDIYYKAFNEK